MQLATSLLDLSAIAKAHTATDPYPFFMGSGFLHADAIDDLRRDFPDINKPGFLTVPEVEMRGSFRQLIEELEGSEVANAVSAKIGIDLDPLPRLTTIRKFSQTKDGRIHTDSQSKLATFLVYLNDDWNAPEGGRLRVLRGPEDFDDMVAEIPPTMGSIFGFRRADNSWHGHKPFAGERRVVQITWLQDADELERKKKRNKFSQVLKGVFGR
jgi:SM-20-related protein